MCAEKGSEREEGDRGTHLGGSGFGVNFNGRG